MMYFLLMSINDVFAVSLYLMTNIIVLNSSQLKNWEQRKLTFAAVIHACGIHDKLLNINIRKITLGLQGR